MTVVVRGTRLPPALPPGRYRFSGVARSEWTKFRSVRSTLWTLTVTVVVTIGVGVLATSTAATRFTHGTAADRLSFDPTSLSLTGLFLGQLAIGVLGVLVMSGEYGTGTIRSTFAAVPNRPLVLAAKAAMFSGVTLVLGEVLSFAAFLIGQALLAASVPHASLGDPAVLRAVAGSGAYLALLGVFALGLATIIRHTAGSITAFVGVMFILPLISAALPSSIRTDFGKYLPSEIGSAMMSVRIGPGASYLSPWAGLAVLVAYVAITLGIGAWLLVWRDA